MKILNILQIKMVGQIEKKLKSEINGWKLELDIVERT
jgi:hypothetical protein